MVSAQGQKVEPHFGSDEGEGFLPFTLDVQTVTSLQETRNVGIGDLAGCLHDLEADHQHEGCFVLFEEPSVDILVDPVGQVVDDDFYSFAGLSSLF